MEDPPQEIMVGRMGFLLRSTLKWLRVVVDCKLCLNVAEPFEVRGHHLDTTIALRIVSVSADEEAVAR